MRQLPTHMLKRAIQSLSAIAMLLALAVSFGPSLALAGDRPKAPRPPIRLDEMTESTQDTTNIEPAQKEEIKTEPETVEVEEQKPAPKPAVAPAPKPVVAPAPKPAPKPAPAAKPAPAKPVEKKPAPKPEPKPAPQAKAPGIKAGGAVDTTPAPAAPAQPTRRQPQQAKPAEAPKAQPQTKPSTRPSKVNVPRSPSPNDRLRIFEEIEDDTIGPTIKNQEMSDEEAKEAMDHTLQENCDDCKKKPTGGLLGPVVDTVKDIGDSIKSSYDEEDFQTFKQRYEKSNQTKCLDSSMYRGIRVGRNLCYRAVKTALQRTQLVGKGQGGRRIYLEGNSASMALEILKSDEKTGGRPHINLMDQYKGKVNSKNAPIGSILVYRGPWIPIKATDARAQQLPRCRGSHRGSWRNNCLFTEYGQLYIYRNYVEKPDGRKYYCSGAGTQHGHIEVRTSRGYSHFTETARPIDQTHPGCRVLTGVMADPKFIDADHDENYRCPTGGGRMDGGSRAQRGRRVR